MEDTTIKMQDLSIIKNGTNDNKKVITPKVYLIETFYISTKKNTVFQVKLTDTGLCLKKDTNGQTKEQTILLQDIIGCRCLRSKRKGNNNSSCACTSLPGPQQLKVVEDNSGEQDESDISAYLYIYAYILKRGRKKLGRRERTTITLRFRSYDKYDDNNREAQKWRSTIKYLINDQSPIGNIFIQHDLRKLLIIINPKAGSGKAREIFQQRIAPILLESEVSYELQVTKFANYAREFIRNKDIYLWRGVVVVGGDGIFFEIINGLCERIDWEKAFHDINLAIIPCGSGNGLARTIAYSYNEPYEPKPVLGATLNIVRGRTTKMHLVRVETRSKIMFSFLSVGWGLISDIDIESERLRAIGGQRFTIWSVHRLISLRTYNGTLSYLPATINNLHINNNDNNTSNNISTLKHSMSYNTTLDCPDCHGEGDCETFDTDFDDVLSLETTMGGPDSFRPRLDSWYSAASRKSAYFSTSESIYQSINEKHSMPSQNGDPDYYSNVQMYGPPPKIPALTTPVPNDWVKITGDFVMVHAAYQTHLGSECYFAPSSKLNDGIIWLLIIKAGVSRSQLLSFLLGLNTGTHMPTEANPYIQMLPVKAFRIEPTGNQGIITVDGESVEYGPIQGEIFSDMANIMIPYNVGL